MKNIVKRFFVFFKKPLTIYKNADFHTQQKVKILYSVFIILSVFVPLMFLFFYMDKASAFIFYLIMAVGIVFYVIGYCFFLKGYHKAASHMVLIVSFMILWGIIFFENSSNALRRMDTIVYIYAVLTLVPLLMTGKKLPVVFYFGINYCITLIFIIYVTPIIGIASAAAFEYTMDITFSMCFVFLISISIFTISRNTIGLANEEIEQNLLLNAVLEDKVVQRTAQLERYKSFVEAADQGFGIAEFNGDIVYANKAMAKIFRQESCEKMVGRKLREFYEPQVLVILKEQIIPAIKKDGRWKGQLPVKTDAGENILTENTFFILKDSDGIPLYSASIITDITDWVSTVKELEEVNKVVEKTSLLAGTAEVATGTLHNVGNILNSVSVTSARLKDEITRSRMEGIVQLSELVEKNKENLDQFLRSEKGRNVLSYIQLLAENFAREREGLLFQMDDLIRKVEHMAGVIRLQQNVGGSKCSRELSDLGIIINEAFKMVEEYISKRRISVEIESMGSFFGYFDQNRLMQILINLFRNAAQALEECDREDKRISLFLRVPNSTVVMLEVRDNGKGIASGNLARIFEYGFTTRKEGHGYGLSYCFRAASEMGGELSVESSGEGQGASFFLTIPYVQPDDNSIVNTDGSGI